MHTNEGWGAYGPEAHIGGTDLSDPDQKVFDGDLDEVRLSGGVLSADRVALDYASAVDGLLDYRNVQSRP